MQEVAGVVPALLGREPRWHPQIPTQFGATVRHTNAWRQNADDGGGRSVHGERASDDRGAGSMRRPCAARTPSMEKRFPVTRTTGTSTPSVGSETSWTA